MKTNQETSTQKEIPVLVKIVLLPDEHVYKQCSPNTQNNINMLAKYVAFGVILGGGILGAAISKFCFNSNPFSYLLTLPVAACTYWLIDRSIAMADSKKKKNKETNEADKPRQRDLTGIWRLGVAIVFAIFNGLLIDNYMFAPDIEAAIQRETIAKRASIQTTFDSLKVNQQTHKDRTLAKIQAGKDVLKERNDELIQEAQGQSPSHQSGIGTIYNAKMALFLQERREFERDRILLLGEVVKDDSTMIAIDAECKKQKAQASSQISKGFIHQFELLHEVIMQNNHTILLAGLFFLICMIVELIPLFGKKQTNIEEYHKLAKGVVKAHIEAASIANNNLIKQTEHILRLENHRVIRKESLTHSQALLRLTFDHHEEILRLIKPHMKSVTELETDMRENFPYHFDEHLRPVLDHVYNKFHENEQAAQNYIPVNEEKPKLN